MFYKPREEICVASMINGTMIDEKTGKGVGEPIGINFAPGLVGDPELKAKAVFIEGQADIKKFNFTPVPLSMCMSWNMINDTQIGPHIFSFYNDIMTKKKDEIGTAKAASGNKKGGKLIGIK